MDDEQTRPWVIVGGGLAAGRAATTLRKDGFDGRLIVVTDEPHPPYQRPPLTKDYLRGETKVEKLLAAEPQLCMATAGTPPRYKRLVAGRLPIDRDRFVDPAVPLAELLPAEQPA